MNTRMGVIALLAAGSMRTLGDPTVRVAITFDRDI